MPLADCELFPGCVVVGGLDAWPERVRFDDRALGKKLAYRRAASILFVDRDWWDTATHAERLSDFAKMMGFAEGAECSVCANARGSEILATTEKAATLAAIVARLEERS